MLTQELMGAALLALSWVTALLVAGDALIDVRAVRARLAAWSSGLFEGVVDVDELGTHDIEQRVRVFDGPKPTLGFFDRSHVSHLTGGRVLLNGESVEVVASPDAEVWTSEAARAQAAACGGAQAFDELAAKAKGSTGALRVVRTSLKRGQRVWLAGVREGASVKARLAADFDPRTWARARLARLVGLIALNFAWVGLGTALVFTGPRFGLVCIGGAVVLVAHFLGLTPIAIAVREFVRPLPIAFLRGEWTRPS